MSKNIGISEGGTVRVFGNTKKLETKLQGNDNSSCYWVLENETQGQPIDITENGMYEASDAVYGFTNVHVKVLKKITDDEGVDWDVHIDEDDIPHITLDDPDSGPDISIDDGTGDIDVHTPGNDPDDWPEWDNLDPDVKPEFDDWMDDPKIPGDWPGWDDLAPEIVDEFDNWIDDGNDPDLWPGWDDLDPDAKTDFDEWMDDPKDPDDWPGWEDIDPDIKTDFDDWITDIDVQIDPEEAGLDPDEDVDASIDPDDGNVNLGGTDTDGDNSMVNYDPKTGETVENKMPSTITVDRPPIITTYFDKQSINFSGIVVKASLNSGDAWQGEGYPDGIIPYNELVFPVQIADIDQADNRVVDSILLTSPVIDTKEVAWVKNEGGKTHNVGYSWVSAPHACFHISGPNTFRVIVASDEPFVATLTTQIGETATSMTIRANTEEDTFTYGSDTVYYGIGIYGYTGSASLDKASGFTIPFNDSEVYVAWSLVYGNTVVEAGQNVPVYWLNPNNGEILTTSFEITVLPSKYGGGIK